MAEPDKRPVTMEELLVSSLAQTDALAKLLIEKGLITRGAGYFAYDPFGICVRQPCLRVFAARGVLHFKI